MSALWLLSGTLVGFGTSRVGSAEPFWALVILAGCFAAVAAALSQKDQA